MTADEAKQALKEGKKIKHADWQDGKYMEGDTLFIKYAALIFDIEADDNWEIVK